MNTITDLLEELPFAKCDGCGRSMPATQQKNYPDNGWALPYEEFGYYGGFTDNISVLLSSEPSKLIVLCHDCVIKILDALPLLKEFLADQRHNCQDSTPCCDYAWQATELFGKYIDGKAVPGVHVLHSYNGAWINVDEDH